MTLPEKIEHVLFYDTETTGFMNRGKGIELDDPNQPYVVQLGAKLHDENRNVIDEMDVIINWGCDIPAEATKIHGITKEIAEEKGVDPQFAITRFNEMCRKAHVVVGHNGGFDNQIYAVACARLEIGRVLPKDRRCTMRLSKDIVKCPPTEKMLAKGRTEYKPPSLSEAYEFFTGEKLEGAHNAMIDVDGCIVVYYGVQDFTE